MLQFLKWILMDNHLVLGLVCATVSDGRSGCSDNSINGRNVPNE